MQKALRTIKVLIAIMFVIGSLGFGAGCKNEPRVYYDSYDELKARYTDQPDLAFPDLSDYDMKQFQFMCDVFDDGTKPFGYSIYGDTSSMERLNRSPNPSSLSCISVSTYRESAFKDDPNSLIHPFEANISHRGIPMEALAVNTSEQLNQYYYESSPEEDYLYPRGTQQLNFLYQFDLDGYRYAVAAAVLLSPEELKEVTVDEALTKGQAELLAVVDDLLDQRGVPR